MFLELKEDENKFHNKKIKIKDLMLLTFSIQIALVPYATKNRITIHKIWVISVNKHQCAKSIA